MGEKENNKEMEQVEKEEKEKKGNGDKSVPTMID
jgi:hypothetical protein